MQMINPDPVLIPTIASAVAVIAKLVTDYLSSRKKDERLEEAEREAFRGLPDAVQKRLEQLAANQGGLEARIKEFDLLLAEQRDATRLGPLFNLYRKQIEKYQDETRSRAGWSFVFAIIAMVAGLGFLFWGGSHILTATNWSGIVAGSSISAIGGVVSAFITKTFLDVHKLSLTQLNRYFRQPVLNEHILTAQRLADELGDPGARLEAYRKLISRVTALVSDTTWRATRGSREGIRNGRELGVTLTNSGPRRSPLA